MERREVLVEIKASLEGGLEYVKDELAKLEPVPPDVGGEGVQAIAACDFTKRIVMNTHLNWRSTVWGQPAWRDMFKELGVKYVRTAVGTNKATITDLQYIGAKAIGLCEKPDKTAATQTLDVMAANPGLFFAVEGPNEFDHNNPPGWVEQLREFTAWLYDEVGKRQPIADLPVIGPSMWGSKLASYNALGDISNDIDAGNLHYYTGGNKPTVTAEGDDTAAATTLDEAIRNAGIIAPGLPIWVTETGWGVAGPNLPLDQWYVTPLAQAKYCMRTLCEMYIRGVPRTALYTLIDDVRSPPRYHGMLTQALEKRGPWFNGMRDMIVLFGNDDTPSPGKLAYTVSGEGFLQLPLMQRSDGTFILVFWQDAVSYDQALFKDLNPPPKTVTVEFAAPVNVRMHTPLNSSEPFAAYNEVTKVTPGVPDHLLVIEVDA